MPTLFQEWFERNLAFSPPVFFGRGIFQYNWGIVPYRKPLHVVVGKPIKVEKNENPTTEELLAVHEEYKAALQALYEEYNPVYGDKEVKLVLA